jgi:hypothetical protein
MKCPACTSSGCSATACCRSGGGMIACSIDQGFRVQVIEPTNTKKNTLCLLRLSGAF